MERLSIDDLARRLADAVPAGLRAMRDDLEQNFRSVLRSGVDRLELVSREEFEVQQAVLARTRQKLEALEARLAELESSKKDTPGAGVASAAGSGDDAPGSA